MAKKQTKGVHNTPTPHINARYGDIAKRVIMPGDPKRASWIADTFLTDAKLVSDVRGMLGFTGKYKNVPVTVMAHGMGIPSCCIYTFELYKFYDVKVIYRIGSCGCTNKSKCKVGDVVLANKAWSDISASNWLHVKEDEKHIFYPTRECNLLIAKTAREHRIPYSCRSVLCANFFYSDIPVSERIKRSGCDIDEMESYGLFAVAKRLNKKAACLLTVSDNMDTGKGMSSLERQTKFTDMVQLALEAIIKEKV